MLAAVRDVDELLRGRFTRPAELAAGRIALPAWRLAAAALVLGATYGACMGLFAALRGTRDGALQLSASIAKVPLLFRLTLLVPFPSLYVCSALANSRLQIAATLRLLLTAITVELALLASLGPVTGFFALCTDSYPFMVLLHTGFLAGCLVEAIVADRPFIPALGWPMLVVVVLAQGLRWWCISVLGHQWNTRVIVVPGSQIWNTALSSGAVSVTVMTWPVTACSE